MSDKSDPHAVKPEDFTVISTDWRSPWLKNVEYDIPSDLPAWFVSRSWHR